MPSAHTGPVHAILIWGPNWLGDCLLSIPTVRALKNRYPESHVTYAVRHPLEEILASEKSIDELLALNQGERGPSLFALIRKLRQARFDLAIALPNSFRAGFMLFLSGAGTRIGYASDSRGFLLTHTLPARGRRNEGHRVEYFLNLAARAGCRDLERSFSIEIPAREKTVADKILNGLGIDSKGLLIGIHPGASKPPRTLSPGNFTQICRLIHERWKARILLFGNKQEQELIRQVRANHPSVFPIRPDTSLMAMAALLQRCQAFIGCDSGLMHLAAAVGTPVVGIFGPGVPEHTGPVCETQKKILLFHRFPCAPCRQRFFRDCSPSQEGRPPCIEAIDIQKVLDALQGLLAGVYDDNQ